MRELTYDIGGGQSFVCWDVPSGGKLDQRVLEVQLSNDIPGLAKPVRLRNQGIDQLRFLVSTRIPLSQFVARPVPEDGLMRLVSSVVNCWLGLARYSVPGGCLVLDADYVFVAPASAAAEMICLPVSQPPPADLAGFLRGVLRGAGPGPGPVGPAYSRLLGVLAQPGASVEELAAAAGQAPPPPPPVPTPVPPPMPSVAVPAPARSQLPPPPPQAAAQSASEPAGAASPSPERAIDFGLLRAQRTGPITGTTVIGGPAQSGLPGQLRVIVCVRTGRQAVVDKAEFFLGRNSRWADFAVEDNSNVSSAHAIIRSVGDQHFIMDTNSTNHVMVNGQRITANQDTRLSPGDTFVLGDEEFEFR
ncbi:MAG: FHA domain-containing protein [Bifidobacteriaceae bacterium]|nr:FHA domain-containing protein [Bifidobacteriaceae bacterium]